MPTEQKTQLQRAADAFMLDKEVQGCTRLTLVWYQDYISRLVAWLTAQGITAAGGITLDLLRAYIVDVQGRGLAPKTIHHHAAAAKTFCKWLAAEGLVQSDPAERLPRPKVPKKVLPALTKDDTQKLLAACENERDRALLLFMLDTGARRARDGRGQHRGRGHQDRGGHNHQGQGAEGAGCLFGRAQSAGGPALSVDPRGYRGRCALVDIADLRRAADNLGGNASLAAHGRASRGPRPPPHGTQNLCHLESKGGHGCGACSRVLLGHSDLSAVQGYLALAREDLADAHREHGAVDKLLGKQRG